MAPLAADCGSNGGVSAKAARARRSILKRANSSPAERENLLSGGDPDSGNPDSGNHSKKPSTSSSSAVADSHPPLKSW